MCQLQLGFHPDIGREKDEALPGNKAMVRSITG